MVAGDFVVFIIDRILLLPERVVHVCNAESDTGIYCTNLVTVIARLRCDRNQEVYRRAPCKKGASYQFLPSIILQSGLVQSDLFVVQNK